MRSPKLPAANDSRRVYAPHGIRTTVLYSTRRCASCVSETVWLASSRTKTSKVYVFTKQAKYEWNTCIERSSQVVARYRREGEQRDEEVM